MKRALSAFVLFCLVGCTAPTWLKHRQVQRAENKIEKASQELAQNEEKKVAEAAGAATATDKLLNEDPPNVEGAKRTNSFVVAALPKPPVDVLARWDKVFLDIKAGSFEKFDAQWARLQQLDAENRSLREERDAATSALTKLQGKLLAESEEDAKLFRIVVWVASIAAALCTVGAMAAFYLQNPRIAWALLKSAAIFGAAAMGAAWLKANQWVIWVALAAGAAYLFASWYLKRGYDIRSMQVRLGDENA